LTLSDKMTTGATTKQQLRYVDVATRLVGNKPSKIKRKHEGFIYKTVWVGIVIENCPNMSLKVMAKHAGWNTHTGIPLYRDNWFRMPWRDRHGWLMLAEKVANCPDFLLNLEQLDYMQSRLDDLKSYFVRGIPEECTPSLGRDGFLT